MRRPVRLNRVGGELTVSEAAPTGRPDVQRQLQANRDRLLEIASEFGLSNLRVAPTGRLVVDVSEGGNYDTLAAFDQAVADELGIRVDAHPSEVLDQPGHGADLDAAVPV